MNKRKQLIVLPPLQYKLVFIVLLSFALPAIIFYFWSYTVFQNALALLDQSSETLQNALLLTLKEIFWIMIIGMGTMSGLMIYWCFIFSNRIVGPIFRLEKDLENMLAKDQIEKIRFRRDDAFQSLTSKLNYIIEDYKRLKEGKEKQG